VKSFTLGAQIHLSVLQATRSREDKAEGPLKEVRNMSSLECLTWQNVA
jgi:hypothetical protein